jgi:hypothetical protein
MVLAPNDLFSWNNKYNKYNEYNITDTFTCFFLAMHTTYSVHAGILKPWKGRLPWLPAVFSFCHVLSLSLSGFNWRSLFPPRGSGPPFPKMAPPFTGSAHSPLPGSGTKSAETMCLEWFQFFFFFSSYFNFHAFCIFLGYIRFHSGYSQYRLNFTPCILSICIVSFHILFAYTLDQCLIKHHKLNLLLVFIIFHLTYFR